MIVRMTETQKGSPNGIAVNTYEKGEEYDLPESLASSFIKMKSAEKVKRTVEPPEKQVSEVPEKKTTKKKGLKKLLNK